MEKTAKRRNASRNNVAGDITLTKGGGGGGGGSLESATKPLADGEVNSGDKLKFAVRPPDWKHRTASIKFKITTRALFGEKRELVKLSKPKVIENLQWMAETYCKDGENIELFLYCGGEDHGLKFLHETKESNWKCLVHFAQFKIKNWHTGKSETRRGWEEPAEFTPRGKCKWGYTKFVKVAKIQENVKDYVNDHGQLQFEIDFYPERIQAWF